MSNGSVKNGRGRKKKELIKEKDLSLTSSACQGPARI